VWEREHHQHQWLEHQSRQPGLRHAGPAGDVDSDTHADADPDQAVPAVITTRACPPPYWIALAVISFAARPSWEHRSWSRPADMQISRTWRRIMARSSAVAASAVTVRVSFSTISSHLVLPVAVGMNPPRSL